MPKPKDELCQVCGKKTPRSNLGNYHIETRAKVMNVEVCTSCRIALFSIDGFPAWFLLLLWQRRKEQDEVSQDDSTVSRTE